MPPKKAGEPCIVEGCDRHRYYSDGMCSMHSRRVKRTGKVGPTGVFKSEACSTGDGRWRNMVSGHIMVKVDGILTYEHIVLAEKALGRKLPHGAVVHHTGAPDDNYGQFKLVICPDQKYHTLLHKRMRER